MGYFITFFNLFYSSCFCDCTIEMRYDFLPVQPIPLSHFIISAPVPFAVCSLKLNFSLGVSPRLVITLSFSWQRAAGKRKRHLNENACLNWPALDDERTWQAGGQDRMGHTYIHMCVHCEPEMETRSAQKSSLIIFVRWLRDVCSPFSKDIFFAPALVKDGKSIAKTWVREAWCDSNFWSCRHPSGVELCIKDMMRMLQPPQWKGKLRGIPPD